MPTVTAESRQYCTLLPRHAMRQEENRRIKDPRYLTPDLYIQRHPNTLHRSLLLLSPLYLCVYLCQHRYSAVLRSAVFYSELLLSVLIGSVLISSNLHCTVLCRAVLRAPFTPHQQHLHTPLAAPSTLHKIKDGLPNPHNASLPPSLPPSLPHAVSLT
jgi:hypothetical protein